MGKNLKKEEENLSMPVLGRCLPSPAAEAEELTEGALADAWSHRSGSMEPCQASPQFILCQFNKCTT